MDDPLAERPPAAERRGTINLRIEEETRRLINDAAAVVGKTLTDFMIDSARQHAIDVLLDQRLFLLSADQYAAFINALDNPPLPGEKLNATMRRTPAWDRV